jgi:HEPN domain-containing protein
VNRTLAQKWLKQAIHDLEMAGRSIDIEGYDVAAFLAHQSVEKLLKALFAVAGRDIPRTHYIDELADQLGVPEEVKFHVQGLLADYMVARYPDVSDTVPYEQYTVAIAREKVGAATQVFELLKSRYAETLGGDRDG